MSLNLNRQIGATPASDEKQLLCMESSGFGRDTA